MVAKTHPLPVMCRFEMAEDQAPMLAPKKLKLSLGKECRFNMYAPMKIQNACKGYTPHNTQRSTQWVLRVFQDFVVLC